MQKPFLHTSAILKVHVKHIMKLDGLQILPNLTQPTVPLCILFGRYRYFGRFRSFANVSLAEINPQISYEIRQHITLLHIRKIYIRRVHNTRQVTVYKRARFD